MKPTKNRGCTGKARYEARRGALAGLRRLVRLGAHAEALNVYACSHCGGYHVGHRPGRRR